MGGLNILVAKRKTKKRRCWLAVALLSGLLTGACHYQESSRTKKDSTSAEDQDSGKFSEDDGDSGFAKVLSGDAKDIEYSSEKNDLGNDITGINLMGSTTPVSGTVYFGVNAGSKAYEVWLRLESSTGLQLLDGGIGYFAIAVVVVDGKKKFEVIAAKPLEVNGEAGAFFTISHPGRYQLVVNELAAFLKEGSSACREVEGQVAVGTSAKGLASTSCEVIMPDNLRVAFPKEIANVQSGGMLLAFKPIGQGSGDGTETIVSTAGIKIPEEYRVELKILAGGANALTLNNSASQEKKSKQGKNEPEYGKKKVKITLPSKVGEGRHLPMIISPASAEAIASAAIPVSTTGAASVPVALPNLGSVKLELEVFVMTHKNGFYQAVTKAAKINKKNVTLLPGFTISIPLGQTLLPWRSRIEFDPDGTKEIWLCAVFKARHMVGGKENTTFGNEGWTGGKMLSGDWKLDDWHKPFCSSVGKKIRLGAD